MTATRDRRRDPDVGLDVTEWGERSAFGSVKGWPWWACLLLALGLSIIGAVIDMNSSGNLSKIFEAAYFIGCVGAVCMVRRRNLFGPTVQAPLILAVTIPVVVVLTKGLPAGSGMMSKLLALGVPLVTGFPTMAITTGATVVIGAIRWLAQRKPADAESDSDWVDADDEPQRRPSGRDGDRGSAPRKPRPSGSSGSSRDRADRDRGDRDRPARDDRAAPRERSSRSQPSARSRSDAPERSGRSSGSKVAGSKATGSKPTGGKSTSGRSAADRDRGREPRSGQSRDRGQQPRRSSSSRDEGRRQPPRRRDDDDY